MLYLLFVSLKGSNPNRVSLTNSADDSGCQSSSHEDGDGDLENVFETPTVKFTSKLKSGSSSVSSSVRVVPPDFAVPKPLESEYAYPFVPPVLNHPDSQYFNFLSFMEETYVVWDPLATSPAGSDQLFFPNIPIVFASPSFCNLTGYSHAEIVGRTCADLLHGSATDANTVSLIRQAVLEGREAYCK